MHEDISTETFTLNKSGQTIEIEYSVRKEMFLVHALEADDRTAIDEIEDDRVDFGTVPITIPDAGEFTGIKISEEIADELRAEQARVEREMEEWLEAKRNEPLTFEVQQDEVAAIPGDPEGTLLMPSKDCLPTSNRLSSRQRSVLERLEKIFGTNRHNAGSLRAPDEVEVGETYSLEEVIDLAGEEYDGLVEAEEERKRAAEEKESRRESLNAEVEDRSSEGSGETHTEKARVTLTDPETGESGTFEVWNTVDLGSGISAESEMTDGFEERGREYLREFSPIYMGHRQMEGQGR